MCKFSLPRRDKLISILHIMHISNGKAPALLKIGTNDFPVNSPVPVLFLCPGQQLCLQRIIPPQGGISPADNHIINSGFLRHLCRGFPDFQVGPGGLFHGKSPGICQYVKQLSLLFKASLNAVIGPICVHGNIMDRLHSGGVIVQYYDFMSVFPAFFFQQGLHGCYIHFGVPV